MNHGGAQGEECKMQKKQVQRPWGGGLPGCSRNSVEASVAGVDWVRGKGVEMGTEG